MKEILNSQLFSLVIGAVLTIITSVIVGKKTYVNSLDEKIADERIAAYKKVYNTIAKLNHSLSPYNTQNIPVECCIPYKNDGVNKYRLAFGFPIVFLNFNEFHNFKSEISIVLNKNRIYLEQSVYNRLFFLDDYLSEVWHIANGRSDDFLQMIGFILGSELDKLRDEIEKDIQEFFVTGKSKMKKSNSADPYKYVIENIKKTKLYTLREDLKSGNCYGNLPMCTKCVHRGKCPINDN